MRPYLLSITCLFLISSLSLLGQSNSKYFDDGNISNARHKVKLNLASAYVGDINLSYEYKINDVIGVELGAGLLMSYYNELLATRYAFINDPNGGYSWHANVRWYYREFENANMYFAPLIRVRNYRETLGNLTVESKINFRDLGFVQGYQMNFSKLVVDVNAGVAFRDVKIDEEDFLDGFSDDFVYIIALKLGYMF